MMGSMKILSVKAFFELGEDSHHHWYWFSGIRKLQDWLDDEDVVRDMDRPVQVDYNPGVPIYDVPSFVVAFYNGGELRRVDVIHGTFIGPITKENLGLSPSFFTEAKQGNVKKTPVCDFGIKIG